MKFAVIGTGSRAELYYNALVNEDEIKEKHQLVALLDQNQVRMLIM